MKPTDIPALPIGRHETAGAPITILLVDDDSDCRSLIKDAIDTSGVTTDVVEMPDGMAALAYLHGQAAGDNRRKPGLIFLDIEMPRLDGIETLRRIKADPQLRDIPVVIMSGVAEGETIKRAAEYGANSYTVKPADAEKFLRTVLASANYWLRVHQFPDHHLPQDESRR